MKKHPLVFLSGPFSGTLPGSIEANIHKALEAALWCMEQDVPFLCPNLLGIYPSMRGVPYAKFLGFVLMAWLPQADAIVMLPGWRESPGCVKERDEAVDLGLSVYEWSEFRQLVLQGVL